MKQLEHKVTIKNVRETADSPHSYVCDYLDPELGWIPYCARANQSLLADRILQLISTGDYEIAPYSLPFNVRLEEANANRRAAYSARVSPYLEEALIKQAQGKTDEHAALMRKAQQERERIQAEIPMPTE